jgi:hypothetical protein
MLAWWRQSGEPLFLSAMFFAAITLPFAAAAGLLSLRQIWQVALALVWLSGVLMLPRLIGFLRHGYRRSVALALIGGGSLLAVLALQPGDVSRAGRGWQMPPERAASVVLLQQDQAQDAGSLTFKAPPRISREMFAQLLQQGTGGGGTSPAAPEADRLYDILLDYELDPAVALAFFAQESQFCTTGICASHDMHSWGGQRAAHKPERGTEIVQARSGPFVSFASWEEGLRDWCELILDNYVGRGLDTVARAVPVYAPAFDGNNPDAYIDSIQRRVAIWRGQDPGVITDQAKHTYNSLEHGLLTETFMANNLDYNPTWAFHNYMVDEARAGRPLGSPMGESRHITVGGQRYVIQPFALDTLYTPLADVESDTNWGDVRRLSDLMRAPGTPAAPPAVPAASPPATATTVPTPTTTPTPEPPGSYTIR